MKLVAYEPGDVDAAAVTLDGYTLAFFTMTLKGKREVVGLQVAPPVKDVRSWLTVAHEEFQAHLPRPGRVKPINTVLLRQSIPLKELMALRADRAPSEPLPALEGDLGRLEDAALYVDALERGVSPAELIANHRGVSVRTAEGRIQRARHAGFLTPAQGRRRGGELTPRAKRLLKGATIG